MRIFTFFTILFFSIAAINAQVVLVNAPADLAGGYTFGDTGGTWGANLLDSIWTGDAILIEDAVDPTSDGCTETMQDLSDKIVLIDRGACEFGVKALNAEMANAVAVIIMNINPGEGALGLGAGAVGAQVTIPVVMVSYEDGLKLKEGLLNGTVNISMGAIQFANDLQIDQLSTLKPFTGTIPSSQVASGNNIFTPTARITNTGFNDAVNVTSTVTIDFTPDGGTSSNVYTESADTTILPTDSLVALSTIDFDLDNPEKGRYEVTYTITSDSTDLLPIDNVISETFDVVEGALARGSWDFDNNRPFVSFNTTIADGGPIEFFQSISFPEQGPLDAMQLDAVTFRIGTDQASLAGESITGTLYSWDDVNMNGVVEDMELGLAGIGSQVFDGAATNEEWVSMEILDANTGARIILDTETTYWMGVKYLGTNTVTIGFDASYNNFLALDGFANSFADFPYLILNDFPDGINGNLADLGSFTDFGATLAIGYLVTPILFGSTDAPALGADVSIYPNPASDVLFADITLIEPADQLLYSVLDINGKVIFSKKVTNIDNYLAKLDAADLAAGTYYLRLIDGNKVQTQSFVIAK